MWFYAFFWLFLVSTSPLPIFFANQLESQYPVLLDLPEQQDSPNILVLGGGHTVSPTLPPNDQLTVEAIGRLVEGIRQYSKQAGACLIGSGGSKSNRTTQAALLMQTATLIGVSPHDTLMNNFPINTEAEARSYAERFGMEKPLVLVTSALHMPRAMYWFQQFGLNPIPAPTNHVVKKDTLRSTFHFNPSSEKISISRRLIHEWVGLLYAKLKKK